MLKLSPKSAEPFWLDILPGVRVQFRPITPAMMIAARRAAAKAVAAAKEASGSETDADGAQGEEHEALANVAYVRSIALAGIVAWDGIGDADGNAIPPTPEAIDKLIEIWTAFDAISALYCFPALARGAEKND